MSSSKTQIKTGSYAVTTVYSVPWTKKKTKTDITPRRKIAEKKILHDIFEKCSELTDDQYWITVFKDCAHGKFPRGFSFNYGILIHRKGNKKVTEVIPNIPSEALEISMKFFKDYAGLMSIADRKKIQKEHDERLLESFLNNEMSWKDIKTARTKEVLISEYVTDLATKSGYNEDQRKELITIIKAGFMLKYFESNNIEMSQGRITNIIGLIYDSETNKYDIDPALTKRKIKKVVDGLGLQSKPKQTNISFMTNWSKYISSLDNSRSKRPTRKKKINTYDSNSLSGDLYSP
jgi:hypothetical protein